MRTAAEDSSHEAASDSHRLTLRADPVGTASLGLAWVLLVIFCGSTFLRTHQGFRPLFDTWCYSSVGAVATVVVGRRAHRVLDQERKAWWAVCIGLALFTLGNLVNGVFFAGLDDPPVPSLADIPWLGFYVFAYGAIVSLIRARHREMPRSVWLDGISGGAGLAAIGAAVAFGPIAKAAKGSHLAVAVNLMYPLGDLLLVVLIGCAFAMEGWRPSRSWKLFGFGILAFAVADTVYLFRVAADSYVEGTPLDALWPLGAVVLAAAAHGSRHQVRQQHARVHRLSVVIVPALFSLMSIALLFVDHYNSFSGVAVSLAGVSALAGLVRFGLTFREVQSLAHSRREARTDELTSLSNRRDFLERASASLAARPAKAAISLLLLDLNRFKEVNDSLGHDVGDELLRQIGELLRSVVHESDLLARLGGDEFAVLLHGADHQIAVAVATRIATTLGAPLQLDGMDVRVGASIGVSCAPEHGVSVRELLKRADIAMYEAKRSGSGHTVFVADLHRNSRERMAMIGELRRGIENCELVLHYQPTIHASDGGVAGVEALVRWQHPERGLLQPVDFVPLAEQAGLMAAFTDAVLEMVVSDLAYWRMVSGVAVRCSINLSVSNLMDEAFPERVTNALRRTGLDASLLVFEITENLLLSDPERAKRSVVALRSLGASVSLDDYGTGYSSMAYLRQLPLDELKLDRSFAADLPRDPTALTFISTAKQLADALGLKLVAEGIETKEMWDQVRSIGCDIGQGFYFAEPMPSDALLEFLRARAATDVHR